MTDVKVQIWFALVMVVALTYVFVRMTEPPPVPKTQFLGECIAMKERDDTRELHGDERWAVVTTTAFDSVTCTALCTGSQCSASVPVWFWVARYGSTISSGECTTSMTTARYHVKNVSNGLALCVAAVKVNGHMRLISPHDHMVSRIGPSDWWGDLLYDMHASVYHFYAFGFMTLVELVTLTMVLLAEYISGRFHRNNPALTRERCGG